jgi:hypothetical protein
MTKEEAVAEFKEYVLPGVRAQFEQDDRPDWPARSEAWNDYTDALQKSGRITVRQYESWVHPKITSGPSRDWTRRAVNWLSPNPLGR